MVNVPNAHPFIISGLGRAVIKELLIKTVTFIACNTLVFIQMPQMRCGVVFSMRGSEKQLSFIPHSKAGH